MEGWKSLPEFFCYFIVLLWVKPAAGFVSENWGLVTPLEPSLSPLLDRERLEGWVSAWSSVQ